MGERRRMIHQCEAQMYGCRRRSRRPSATPPQHTGQRRTRNEAQNDPCHMMKAGLTWRSSCRCRIGVAIFDFDARVGHVVEALPRVLLQTTFEQHADPGGCVGWERPPVWLA